MAQKTIDDAVSLLRSVPAETQGIFLHYDFVSIRLSRRLNLTEGINVGLFVEVVEVHQRSTVLNEEKAIGSVSCLLFPAELVPQKGYHKLYI